MKITFLYHSCFLVELETCSLLFDWYQGPVPEWDKSKPLYIFSSHHHGDQYSPKMFTTFGMENVWYILSTCIHLSAKRKKELSIDETHVFRLPAHTDFDLDGLHVTTLRSTDEGVAFLVKAEGKTLCHAGDLHWWHWEGEPHPWNRDMERDFKAEIARLENEEIDVAFLVLDPRQEGDFWMGMDWIMDHVSIKQAFPMHSWEDFQISRRLKALPCSEPYRERIQDIHHHNETFTV